MIKTSNTTYAKSSHHLQHTDMKNFATAAALVIRICWKSLEKERFNLFCMNAQLSFVVDIIWKKNM